MAEREGFEPPEPFGSTVFKTAAIDRSAISPCVKFATMKRWHGRRGKIFPLTAGTSDKIAA